MDPDVAELLLMLLHNAPMEVRGSEIVKVADLHTRAVAQVQRLATGESNP